MVRYCGRAGGCADEPRTRSRQEIASDDGRTLATPGRLSRLREPGGVERALSFRIGPFGSLLVGIAVAWGAIFLKAMLNEFIDGETGYILLMAAVVVAAWFGGLIGGLTRDGRGAHPQRLIFVAPLPAPPADRAIIFRLFLYLAVGGGVAVLVASRRSAGDRLATRSMTSPRWRRSSRRATPGSRSCSPRPAPASGNGTSTGELTWSDAIFRQHGLEPQPRRRTSRPTSR